MSGAAGELTWPWIVFIVCVVISAVIIGVVIGILRGYQMRQWGQSPLSPSVKRAAHFTTVLVM